MSANYRNLLSLGVLLIIAVAVILLTAFQTISIRLIVPIFLVLAGCWTLALAFMRSTRPKHATGTFGTICFGVFFIASGFAWYIFPVNWLFSIALTLSVLGAIAISAALLRK